MQNPVSTSVLSDLTIENTEFFDNVSDEGGAIFAAQTDVYIENSIFENNSSNTTSSSYKGGAILADESEIELHSNIFSMNKGGTGSAIYSLRSLLICITTVSYNTQIRAEV